MKKKYFFGILLSLFLLCGGVFLLVLDNHSVSNEITINPQTNAATVSLRASVKAYGAKSGSLGTNFEVRFDVYEAGNKNIHDYEISSSTTEGSFSAKLNALALMKKRTFRIAFAYLGQDYIVKFDNGLVDVEHISGGEFNNLFSDTIIGPQKWISLEQTVFVKSYNDDCDFGEKIIYWKIECSLNDNGGTGGSGKVQYGTHSGTMSSINIPTRVGYKFNGYYTSSTSGTQAIDANGKWVWSNSACYPTTLYAHWERTDCGININLKYPNGTEGYEKCGLFDITYHDGKSVSNLSNEERPNGSTLRLPIGKKWTIKNIRPAEGLKFDKIVCTQGLTYSNKGNGVYEFSIDKSKVNTDNDLEIDIYMQYLYKININFYKLDKTSENGGTFNLYKQPSGGSETLVGENMTNEPGSPYLDNNGKFILKNVKASENGACVKLTLENVKLKVANGKGQIKIVDNEIIYTANSTGAGSGKGFDNEILIYTSPNQLIANLDYQYGGQTGKISTEYNSNGTFLNLPSPTERTGYDFKGWSLTSNGTEGYKTDTDWNDITVNGTTVSTPNAGNIEFTLYAIWQANDHTVTLNDESGVSNLADMTWISGATFNETTYTYNANGITSTYNTATGDFTINGTPTVNYIILSSLGLTLIEGEQYKIEVTPKSGSMLSWQNNGYFVLEVCDQYGNNFSTNRQYVDLISINSLATDSTYSTTLTINENSANLGKGLKVWYYAAGTPASQMFTNYTINIKITKVGSTQNVNKKVKATYDSPMRPVTVPSKFGYTFEGYYDSSGTKYYNANGTSARNWDKDSIATLNAKWTPYTYTLTLNGNDGITTDEKTTIEITGSYKSDLTLPSKPFTRSGYIFKGWSTTKTGEVTYSDEANYSSLITSDNISIAFYAQWEETIASNIKSTFATAGTYYISSVEDLAKLIYTTENKDVGNGYTFIQTANIDLSGITYLPIGRLNSFSGTYDGQGYTISGITTYNGEDANNDYLETNGGLFANAGGAKIKNVIIENATIYGQNAGIIAGSGNSSTTISGCIVSGNVNGTNKGSIIGNGNGAKILVCLAKGVNTASFASGSASVDSCIYELNNGNRGQSGTFTKYSEWIYPSNFAYPMPKAFMWYPGAELTEDSLNNWLGK